MIGIIDEKYVNIHTSYAREGSLSSSVLSASRDGVVGGIAALANRVGELETSAVEDVPQVAEVDAIVVHAVGLGARFAGDEASR